MEYVFLSLAVILAGFIALLLIRAATFKPKNDVTVQESEEVFDRDIVITRLAELVKCKTVSNAKRELEDNAEFEKLISLLPSLYPNVFKVCEYKEMSDRALLFKWKGKSEGDPAVLMAHYDVVPVNEEMWEKPPFEAVLENGIILTGGASELYGLDILLSKVLGISITRPEGAIDCVAKGLSRINGFIPIKTKLSGKNITAQLALLYSAAKK